MQGTDDDHKNLSPFKNAANKNEQQNERESQRLDLLRAVGSF